MTGSADSLTSLCGLHTINPLSHAVYLASQWSSQVADDLSRHRLTGVAPDSNSRQPMTLVKEIHSYLETFYADISTNTDSETESLAVTLQECLSKLCSQQPNVQASMKMELDRIRSSSHELMSMPSSNRAILRQLYTDSCLIRCLLELERKDNHENEATWLECIHLLDGAIVFSGAPDRMDTVQRLISYIQQKWPTHPMDSSYPSPSTQVSRPNVTLPPCGREIPSIEEPDMISFLTTWCKRPFVVSRGITHWPAMTSHPWSSQQYLKGVAGRGRIVPVEIGKDYRLDNWGQEMMGWEDFLGKVETAAEPLVYLAQHSLLTQFPSLREDICVPDLVYYSPTTDYPRYAPPANDDGVIINAWLGPKGTISPAHQVRAFRLVMLTT